MPMDKDEGGSEEQGQAGFSADIAQAWDETEADKPEPEVEPEPDKDDWHPRDEGEANEAPCHWSQADKDAFNSLRAELRPLYLEKARSLEAGWNRKFDSLADIRKFYEQFTDALPPEQRSAENLAEAFSGGAAIRDMFEPYRQQLADAQTTPIEYVARLGWRGTANAGRS